MSMDPVFVALFESQFGVARRQQLLALGMTPSAHRNLHRLGELERVTLQVSRVVGSPNTPDQRLRAALLDAEAGAAVSHTSAAGCWQLPGFEVEPTNVIVERPRGGHPKLTPLGTVHYTRRLPDTHVVEREGLRLTTPSRTLFDLAARIPLERMAKLVDRAWSMRLVNHWLLDRTLRELEGRGRPGIVAMRELIEERGVDHRPPDSNLEARFQEIMRQAGLTTLRRQVDSGSSTRWMARVDFRDAKLPLIVQIDSELFHTSKSDQEKDRTETLALEAAGYVVVRVREFDVWHHPAKVLADVHEGIRAARILRTPLR